MDLNSSLYSILGIGGAFAKKLEKLEIFTLKDLIYHFPFRYDDFSKQTSALDAQIGEKVTLMGEVWSIKNVYTRFGKVLTQAIFNDGSSPITLTWFNQSWLTKQINSGDRLQVSGKIKKYKNKLSIVAPVWEKIASFDVSSYSTSDVSIQSLHTGRLVPVYPETFGLTSKWIRTKISRILPMFVDSIKDPLPDDVKNKMLTLNEALLKIHFPENWEDIDKARERLGFDELFFIQLFTQKIRRQWKNKRLVSPLKINMGKLKELVESLPFKLTSAQDKVLREIMDDLEQASPMNRLLQGEVGSGKTVVAAIISYLVFLNNLKVLYMAPTEILAFQHFDTFQRLLQPFGVEVGIYTGSRKYTKGKGRNVKGKDEKLHPDIIIGTHALLSEKLLAGDVGLVIIDEQQRFGVEQRSILRSKAKVPHFLTMTATPIPRTVALTLYGDLDLSIIYEMPKGRKLVKTFVVPSKKRADAYKFIEKKVMMGDQVYIITPLIEPSETLTTVKAAKEEFERLSKKVFVNLKLGLLHGRLKSKEKEEVLNKFKSKDLDILVSTSVVEVGVDVPNATIMVIEGAERFGLAQLHQLRGRVGRGEKESFALLFPGIEEPSLVSRLKNLEKNFNGLELAELDLKVRGSGEIFGTKQSGRFNLKIASLTDLPTLEKAKEAAHSVLQVDPTLDKYPLLKAQLADNQAAIMPD